MNKRQINFMIGTAKQTIAMLSEYSVGGHREKTINEVLGSSRDALERLEDMLEELETE